jgi:hypothetical protein
VVVLDEEGRYRAKIGAVDRQDLRPGGALEHGLVVSAEHQRRAVELAGDTLTERRGAAGEMRELRGEQIPIDLITVGDERVGRKRERAQQQPPADRGGQEVEGVVTAGAGVEQHPERRWPLVGPGKGRQRPRLAQHAAAAAGKRQRVKAPGREIAGLEPPELATGVGHAAFDRRVPDVQDRRLELRLAERGLDQDAPIADRRQQVLHDAGVPALLGRRG